ncbi:CARDB domain-containing protein, partial [Archangium sp.]|uniref:CARDB domain-containing protein n=1 Tax=Archangium sp. TaxID=1872627 RepID=UPI00389A51A3
MTAAVWGTRVIGAVVLLSLGACGKSADEGALERRALRQAASMGPDFIIKSVSGPASATPGQQFTASVTVCNQGTQGDSTDVELYFSSDAIITPPTTPGPTTDQPLGRMPTSFLNPGQCQTLSMSTSAWVPSNGAWYLGAAADPSNSRPELIEDNNALAGTRMGVGNKADFIIQSVSGPASVMSGQQFTASVTVCNQGTQSDSTDVELYFSSDATITPPTTPGP